ncbi:helix-turn-helix transcriptional regulator [Streptomyces palmae]|uniref:WYL domain-containing protein n=1 Tax=Streptomyces palmae TaxID=1701085 RepID=A0A4Z0H594_9ACTN|nr:WYL domain-containing protein [Streptomyces palmae]TGB05893.1 WYL domain-containing protein [Streptomyces palmae]
MRADRLVAVLLFLQSRGRVTAAEVAAELEVSERTARRDLEALATAGIPVYAQRGRGGGWALVGGARTDLTGLNAAEVRALFLVAGPSAAGPELRVALRKLVRALPAPLRPDAEAAARATVADGTDWTDTPLGAATQRAALQQAVLDGVQVRLGYARPGRTADERLVHPLGLADKAGVDYLVANTEAGLRTFRIGRVTSVRPTGDPVIRPEGFDLATAWRSLTGRMADRMRAATVLARAEAGAEPVLRGLLDGRLRILRTLPDGRLEIEVDGPSPEVVAAQLAGFGARVEILEPPRARERLARLAAELATLYGPPAPTSSLPPRAGSD